MSQGKIEHIERCRKEICFPIELITATKFEMTIITDYILTMSRYCLWTNTHNNKTT